MPFTRLLKKFSQPTLARSRTADAESSAADDSSIPQRGRQASESMVSIRRPWKAKRPSSTDHSSPSQSTLTPPLTSTAKGITIVDGVDEMSPPVPAIPNVLLASDTTVPSPGVVSAVGPVPDKLADAWDAVKDDPNIASTGRALDTVGMSSAPLFSKIR